MTRALSASAILLLKGEPSAISKTVHTIAKMCVLTVVSLPSPMAPLKTSFALRSKNISITLYKVGLKRLLLSVIFTEATA